MNAGPALTPWMRAAAYGALVVTSALWGSNGSVARMLFGSLGPVSLSFLRWCLVMLILAPVVWREREAIAQVIRAHWRLLVPLAFLGGVPQNAMTYVGLDGTTAIHLGLLNSSIPVLIILIGWIGYARRPRGLELAGLAISSVGVLLIICDGDFRALASLSFNGGDLVVMCAMLCWSFYTVRFPDRPQGLSLFAFLFVVGLLSLPMALPAFASELLTRGVPHLGLRELLGLGYIAMVPTLGAMFLHAWGVERVGAVQSGFFVHLMPPFAVLFAALLLGEELHPYHAAGFVLVAGGAVLSCWKQDAVLSSRARLRG